MRIAQISTLSTPVTQNGSSSIEYLVWLLTRELVRLGHEVTVFASAGSDPAGELVATQPGTYGDNGALDDWQLCEVLNIARAVEQSERFDVLHSHAYLWSLALQRLSRAPMVHTTHVMPYDDQSRLCRMEPDACVTAISQYQWQEYPEHRPSAVVYHGVDPALFTFSAEPEDYACYMGRFTAGKGPVRAIETAQALGLRLLIAGPDDEPHFLESVKPRLDGRRVEYVGYVGGAEKNQLLRGARVMLYPILEPEPFGLVQVEAMMCGTPVAAISVGAVPEVVDEGVTGSCAPSAAEFQNAVLRAMRLPRREVRRQAEARFSIQRMAREYLQVYEALVARSGAPA